MKFNNLNELANQVHILNKHWWVDANGNSIEKNKGELIALIHSELSEALEGIRKNLQDPHLPHRKNEEVEMADALIRILDYCSGFGLDIEGAVFEKLEYNKTRADHTHSERNKPNGKKF